MRPDARRTARPSRLYRAALALLPAPFRRAHGAAMLQAHADLRHEAVAERGRVAGAIYTARELAGLARLAWTERRRSEAPRQPREGSRMRMDGLANDVRHAARALVAAPGFTLVAVVTFALGIGVSTAVFTLVHGLVLRPLPYANEASLVVLSETTLASPSTSVAYPNFLDWRARQRTFASMAAVRQEDVNITDGVAERVGAALVSHDALPTLGVQPLEGRVFTAEDDRPGAARTAIVRASLCRRRFAATASVLGRTLSLDGRPHTIVGVVPDEMRFPANATEVWTPLGLRSDDYQNRREHLLQVVGRLKPGVDLARARTDMAAIARQLEAEFPDSNAGAGVRLERLTDALSQSVRPAMWVLAAAAGCVLLIACANVVGLLIVRASARRREFAIRAALGAGRARLAGHWIIESVLLGLGGTIGGLLIALALVDLARSLLPPGTPGLPLVRLDRAAFAFGAAAAAAAGLAVGALTAWRTASPELSRALAHAGHRGSTARERARTLLVAGEFTLTVVLLCGSGLMIRSLDELGRANLGYVTDRVLTFSYDRPQYAFASQGARLEAERQIVPRLEALPGVVAVGYSTVLPLSDRPRSNAITIDGAPEPPQGTWSMADTANVSPAYFRALGIPIARGRGFSDADGPDDRRVAIIDTAFADRHFPGHDPIGRRLKIGDAASDLPWMTIVGVVPHIETYGVDRSTGPQLYRPTSQAPGSANLAFALRTRVQPATLQAAVRRVFQDVSPAVPIFGFQTMRERFGASIWERRVTALLLGSFAALAVALAAIGLYGVLSYTVTERTREMGIRLALGASPRDLLARVAGRAVRLAGAGTAIGLTIAAGITRLMQSLLYGTSPLDPATFGAVALIVLAVGLAAGWLPARRVTRVDPVEVLKAD